MNPTQFVPILVWPVAAVVLAALVVLTLWNMRLRILKALGLEALGRASPSMGGVLALAIILSPFWLILLYYSLTSFFVLSSQPVLQMPADRQAGHFVAVAVVIVTVAALVSVPIVLVRAWLAERRTISAEALQTTEAERLASDRFNAAVMQLGAQKRLTRQQFKPVYQRIPGGKIRRDDDGLPMVETDGLGQTIGEWDVWEEIAPNIEQRIGALFALERIARESEADHIPAMETIAAYIRENAEAGVEVEETPDAPAQFLPPRADIQMALRILGRRGADRMAYEARQTPPFRIDLRGADLPLADLAGLDLGPLRLDRANLAGAWFDGADLSGAELVSANLRDAWMEECRLARAKLEEADMRGAWVVNADLRGAKLDGADLSGARLRGSDMAGAELDRTILHGTDFSRARLYLAWLRGADLRGADHLLQAQVDDAFGDHTTRLPAEISRPDWPEDRLTYVKSFEMWQELKVSSGLA